MTAKILVLTVALAVALSACSEKSDAGRPTIRSETPTISIARVVLRPIGGAIAASGLLVPREEATVGSELSGYRVAAVFVEEGASVRKGQPLAKLDSALLQAKIKQARAGVSQAAAQAQQARGEADRVKHLDGTGILSAEQIASRRNQAASANAGVEVAQAQLDDLLTQDRRMVIRAPVGGAVLERMVKPGDVASPAQPMFRIARDNLIELDAEVPEEMLKRIAVGNAATVTTPSGTTLQGVVRLVSPRVDPQTKLGRIRVRLPRNDDLRAGGYASAVFDRSATPTRAVSEKAVQFEASGPKLIVIDAQNRAHPTAVKTGARSGGFVALESGPPVGARVALGSGASILEGDLVRPEDAAAASPPPRPRS